MTLAEIGVCMFAGSMVLLLIVALCMVVRGTIELFSDGDWLMGMLGVLAVMMIIGFGIVTVT